MMKAQQITYLNGKVILPDDSFKEIKGMSILFEQPVNTKKLVEALNLVGEDKGYSVGYQSTIYKLVETLEDMKKCNCAVIKKINKWDKIKFLLAGVWLSLIFRTIIEYLVK